MCGTSSGQYGRVNGESRLEVILICKLLVHTQTVVASVIGLSELRTLMELCRKQTVMSDLSIFVLFIILCVCFFLQIP
jgi:hypothetical protein